MNAQFLLQFIQQVKGILGFAVHFVDKDYDGRISHTTYLHQFPCLRFHTLGSIHHNDDTIYRRQRTVRILCKVLVTRRVKDVDFVVVIIELHHRSGD